MRGPPLRESRCIIQRGAVADNRPRRLDVPARARQRVEHFDVVAAGHPVQRRLRVRAGEPGVELYRRAGWEMVQSLTAQTLDVWIMSFLHLALGRPGEFPG